MECNISRRISGLDIACSELRRMDNMISKADIIRLTGFNKTIYNESRAWTQGSSGEDKEQNREISVFNDLISYREKDIGKWRKTVRPRSISKNTAM